MKIANWSALRPRGEDWRNVLAEYDAVVYEIGQGPPDEPLRRALLEWPGVLVLHDDSLEGFFDDDPERRASAIDGAIAVIVHSRDLERRLRAEHPFAEIVFVERDEAATADETSAALLGPARRPARRWLETLLEAAAAELPGFFPGDRATPWRAEVEELLALAAKRGS